MVDPEVVNETEDYARSERNNFLSYSQDDLNAIKSNDSIPRTINAYKGLITRADKELSSTTDKNRQAELSNRISKYQNIIENLEVISKIQDITDENTLSNAISDLQEIAKKDISLRGQREIDNYINQYIKELEKWQEGVQITNEILNNINSDPATMVPILKKFRTYLRKIKIKLNLINSIIKEWRRKEKQRFKTLVWMLKLDTETGEKHGKPNTTESPGGTYILFNIDMNKTTPKELFGKMLNPENIGSKEDIYHWFKRKYTGGWTEHEWAEHERNLVVMGFGYVDYNRIDKQPKWNRELGKYVEVDYPMRVYDESAFMEEYLKWKTHWMKRLRLTEAGWQEYISKLNPYYPGEK